MKSRSFTQISFFSNLMIFKAALVIFSALTIAVQAQDANEGADEEPKKQISGRRAWFLCTAIPDNLKNPVTVMVDNKIHEVTLSIRNMSDPFPISGDGMVKIVKEVPNPEKPEAVLYQALSESKVPNNVEQALIILAPAPQKEGQKLIFSSKVLDMKDFKGGDYLYLNLSPKKVGLTLGEQRSILNPGELKIQNNQDIKSATNKILSIHYHSPQDDQWKLIVATTVVVQPTRREICIFHWDEKAERIDYRGATFPIEIEEKTP